jgi:hypothetical protein
LNPEERRAWKKYFKKYPTKRLQDANRFEDFEIKESCFMRVRKFVKKIMTDAGFSIYGKNTNSEGNTHITHFMAMLQKLASYAYKLAMSECFGVPLSYFDGPDNNDLKGEANQAYFHQFLDNFDAVSFSQRYGDRIGERLPSVTDSINVNEAVGSRIAYIMEGGRIVRVNDEKAETQKAIDRAPKGPRVILPFGPEHQERVNKFNAKVRPKWAPRQPRPAPGRSPLVTSSSYSAPASSSSSSGSFPQIVPSSIPGGAASFPVSTSSPPIGWESIPLPGSSGFSQASPITIMDTPPAYFGAQPATGMEIEERLTNLYDPDDRRKMEKLAALVAAPENDEDFKALHRQFRQVLGLAPNSASSRGANALKIVMDAVDEGYDLNQAKLTARDLYLFCKKQGKYKE